MRIRVAEPHDSLATAVAAALRARGHEPLCDLHELDAKDFVHDEAALLDEAELAEAQAALIEDGLFVPGADLRVATKYSWAIAYAVQSATTEKTIWSVAEGSVPTAKDELRFIIAEMKRCALPVAAVSLCWPVNIEPAIDFDENADAFLHALRGYAEIVSGSGIHLFIPNAVGKVSVLPTVVAESGLCAVLDFAGFGWLEAMRLLSRKDAQLFRRALISAQEHFAFDKGSGALCTTEDDIRALPEVSEADLERIFLDDPRGRQLLHVTAHSVAADLGEPLAAFLQHEAAQLDTMITAELDRHFAG